MGVGKHKEGSFLRGQFFLEESALNLSAAELPEPSPQSS